METIGNIGEGAVRLGIFAGIFAVMALLELLIPSRKLDHAKGARWFTNIAIGGIDSLIVRLMALFVIPLAAVSAALWAETQNWGLFNWTDWPQWIEIAIAVVVLDLAIYGQHVASHKIPMLWALHQMHHSDVDFDVTTAIRFHPIEIALSMLWKIVVVLALGSAALAVVIFEVILNGCAMFNHSNIQLPKWLDGLLRLAIVTPDFHRVHHSVIHAETDSNYGFNLSIWDRLFGTYIPQPREGHQGMTIGLSTYQSKAPTGLVWSLKLPFASPPASREKTGTGTNKPRPQSKRIGK
jgi:sterol desaturase/sphingolipid hydroxylase (fatty acid hydroxylase superfamily)